MLINEFETNKNEWVLGRGVELGRVNFDLKWKKSLKIHTKNELNIGDK